MAENKWICPACGQENDGKFCVGCGAAAPAVPAAEPVVEAEPVEAVAAEPVVEAEPVEAVAAEPAEPAEAAPAAEAAPEPAETISVPAEPAYDTTPVDQITETVAEPVAAESVTPAYAPVEPAKVDPDDFVPAEPDHSAASGSYTAPAQTVSDPDNFVPAPMQPQKQQNAYSGSSASAAPKPDGYNQALVGLILAIAGAVFLWVPFLGIGLAVAGLVLAIVAKSKGFNGGMRTAAFIISIISIALSIGGTIGCIACIACSY